jgi:predicted nucleic acid-binding protein
MNAVDTNVFVYALDADEPDKQNKAVDLIDQLAQVPSETVLLWQVAGEFLSCMRRWEAAGRISAADVEANLMDLRSEFPLALPSAAVLDGALDLGTRYSLSHWDSMLLAACIEAGVDTLYSEDMDPGTTYDSVTLINPFS